MNDCVPEPNTISFNCILKIVNKFRAGEVDVELGRMILNQIDGGLSQFGSLPVEPDASIQEEELGAVCEEAEKLCNIYMKEENTPLNILPVLVIVLKMWSLYRKFSK